MGLLDKIMKKKDEKAQEEDKKVLTGTGAAIGLGEGEAEEVTAKTATGALGNEDLEDIKERLKAIQRMGTRRY